MISVITMAGASEKISMITMAGVSDKISAITLCKSRPGNASNHDEQVPDPPAATAGGNCSHRRHESAGSADLPESSLFSPWRLVFGLEPGGTGGHSSSDDSQAEGSRSRTDSPVHRPFFKSYGSKAPPVSSSLVN